MQWCNEPFQTVVPFHWKSHSVMPIKPSNKFQMTEPQQKAAHFTDYGEWSLKLELNIRAIISHSFVAIKCSVTNVTLTSKIGVPIVFVENCMKMKEFQTPRGRSSLAPPFHPPMTVTLFSIQGHALKMMTSFKDAKRNSKCQTDKLGNWNCVSG